VADNSNFGVAALNRSETRAGRTFVQIVEFGTEKAKVREECWRMRMRKE
jgi:hypothetical protein